MDHQLTSVVSTQTNINATVAGTSTITGAAVDTLGYDGVRFIATFGTLTSSQVTSLKAQDSDLSGSGFNDIAGSNTGPMADGDSNKLLILEIYRPAHRYVKPVVVRGTANAVINGVIAELFRASEVDPVTADTSVSAQKILIHPADGTA